MFVPLHTRYTSACWWCPWPCDVRRSSPRRHPPPPATGIFAGWVFTVIATGAVAAVIFSFAIFSPTKFSVPQDVSTCPGDQLFAYDQATGQFNGIACSGADVS